MRKAEKIYDSHCHIYPQAIALKAVDAVERFYDGLTMSPHDGTVDTLLATGRKHGISHFIVHSVATKPEQVSHINRFIAKSVAESNGAFTGMGTMHPDTENLERDLDELCALGLKGVKLHPDIQRFNADCRWAMHLYEMLEDRNLPVLVHTGDYRYDYSNPPRILHILRTFPRLRFIGAHFGGWSVWEQATRILSDCPNVYVDTSSSFFGLKPEKAQELIKAYGSERVMFGTDYPLWQQDGEIEYLSSLDLSDDEFENVCWRTCSRLFEVDEVQESAAGGISGVPEGRKNQDASESLKKADSFRRENQGEHPYLRAAVMGH